MPSGEAQVLIGLRFLVVSFSGSEFRIYRRLLEEEIVALCISTHGLFGNEFVHC